MFLLQLYEYSFGLYIYKLRITAMGFFNVDLGLCQGVSVVRGGTFGG